MILELAERNGIAIVLCPELAETPTNGDFSAEEKKIRLNPARANDQIAYTLIHELRHFWQSHLLGDVVGGDVWASIMAHRVREADARAFADVMWDRIIRENIDGIATAFSVEELAVIDCQKMGRLFWEAIRDLDVYDRKFVSFYYEARLHRPAATEKIIDTSRLMGALRTGLEEGSPNYIGNMSQSDFARTVLRGVNGDIRDLMSLIDSFEKARLSPQETQNRDWEIQRKIVDMNFPDI